MLTNVNDQRPQRSFRATEKQSTLKLFAAFGWCGAQVQELSQASAAFRQALLELTEPRFHLIAMSLATRHARRREANITNTTLGDMLVSHRAKDVIECLYGFYLDGIVRSLNKLPATVLSSKHYLGLLDLLQEPRAPLFSTRSFGSGLGLPTAKQIIQQHGGTIVIRCEPGSGTRVEIALPRANRMERPNGSAAA